MIPDLSKIREMAEQFRATGGELVLPVETVLALLEHIEATDQLLALRTADLASVAAERDEAKEKIIRIQRRIPEVTVWTAERDTLTAKLAEARRVIEEVSPHRLAELDGEFAMTTAPSPPALPLTARPISHSEAREIAQRLINSHFDQEPRARISIPALPDSDDDRLISAYINQQEATASPPAPMQTWRGSRGRS